MPDVIYFNPDAEKSVLAAMMKPDVLEKHIRKITPEDFYDPAHQRLFTAMQTLRIQKKAVDTPNMADEVAKHSGENADGDMMVLFEAIRKHGFAAEFGVEDHIAAVKKAARRRLARQAIREAAKRLDEPENDAGGVLDTLKERLNDLRNGGKSRTKGLNSVLLESFDELEKRAKGENKGLKSGIPVIEKFMAGFHRGELTILGARPAVGKSAMAAHIALAAAKEGARVLICSREMSPTQYGIRVLSRETNIPNTRIRSGELTEDDWVQLAGSLETCASEIGDRIRFTFDVKYIEDLRDEVQNAIDNGELDMLVVDYVQLMQTRQKAEKDFMRIAHISKTLKDMSTDLNIAILALAQVGRSSDGAMPTMAELRGSGDLEQDADNILFLHRPKNGNDEWVHPDDRGSLLETLEKLGEQYVVLNIAKQRQGQTGYTQMIFEPAHMNYRAIYRGMRGQEEAYGVH